MLSEMFAHARKDLQGNTPGTCSTASLSEGSTKQRRHTRSDNDSLPRDGRSPAGGAAPRILLPDFRVIEPVAVPFAQDQSCSVSSSREVLRSPASERKTVWTKVKGPYEDEDASVRRKAYVERLEANLRTLADENRGLRLQHQDDEVRLAEMHLHMEREVHNSLQLRGVIKELNALNATSHLKSKVGVIFDAWFRAAAHAWRERYRAADRALAHAEQSLTDSGPTEELLLRAEGAELRVMKLEAMVETQKRRLAQAEQEAYEAQEESAALRATSNEASRRIKVLTEQLSTAEAALVKEREKLRHEELQVRECKMAVTSLQAAQEEEHEAWTQRLSKAEAALIEQRMRADTAELDYREASKIVSALEAKAANVRRFQEDAEDLRQQMLAQQAVKVEAEKQVGLMEVEKSKVSCKLQLAESELADARAQEARMTRMVQEARAQTEELTLRLQRLEEQRREADDVARVAEADRQSVVFRLQQAAQEVDLAKSTAEAAGLEARQLQDLLAKAKDFDGAPDMSQMSLQLKDMKELQSWSEISAEGTEMEEAVAEIRRWRLEGTPPKMSGSALQNVLKARIAELERQLVAAKAIREQGLQNGLRQELQDGSSVSILPSIASAAVAAARDASCEERLTTLEEELADAKEVQAAAEALMKELFSPSGRRKTSSPRPHEEVADGVRQSPKGEVAEAALGFTTELLEALAACRLELERARPSM